MKLSPKWPDDPMSDNLGGIIQLFGILILFFLILYGAYLASKFAARFQNGRVSGKNMTIIEAISVGPGKTLQIVRVGKTYMVVGVSKDQITYLKEIDPSELQQTQNEFSVSFGNVLDKVLHRKGSGYSVTGEDQDDQIQ